MDDYEEQFELAYRVSEIDTLTEDELREFYRQALSDLRELKLEYDEF
jgi:hypothetical protein